MDHFQRKGLGHFRVRRFERQFGAGEVREAYETLRMEWIAARGAAASSSRG